MNTPTRIGKIARLPHLVRQRLNQRLQAGEPARTIVAWLNSRSDVRAILQQHFAGQPIRQQNLSQWRHGGYQDWLLRQDALEVVRPLTDETHAFTSETSTPLPGALTHWFALRCALATRQIAAADGPEAWKLLRQFGRDAIKLHRTDLLAQRQQLQREKFAFQQEQLRQKTEAARKHTEADHEAWALHPDNHDHLNALWRKTYPDDFEDDTDDDTDASDDTGTSPSAPHQSHGSHTSHPNTSPSHPARTLKDDRTPEQKAAHPAVFVDDPSDTEDSEPDDPPLEKIYDENGNPSWRPRSRPATSPTSTPSHLTPEAEFAIQAQLAAQRAELRKLCQRLGLDPDLPANDGDPDTNSDPDDDTNPTTSPPPSAICHLPSAIPTEYSSTPVVRSEAEFQDLMRRRRAESIV